MRDEPASAITQVERRIELRRARMRRHAEELRAAVHERAKPLPLLGVAAFALAGFAMARGGRATGRANIAAGVVAKTGIAAALIALLQAAVRLGTNPLLRAAWRRYTRRPHLKSNPTKEQ